MDINFYLPTRKEGFHSVFLYIVAFFVWTGNQTTSTFNRTEQVTNILFWHTMKVSVQGIISLNFPPSPRTSPRSILGQLCLVQLSCSSNSTKLTLKIFLSSKSQSLTTSCSHQICVRQRELGASQSTSRTVAHTCSKGRYWGREIKSFNAADIVLTISCWENWRGSRWRGRGRWWIWWWGPCIWRPVGPPDPPGTRRWRRRKGTQWWERRQDTHPGSWTFNI